MTMCGAVESVGEEGFVVYFKVVETEGNHESLTTRRAGNPADN
jgi:hypothetical protein